MEHEHRDSIDVEELAQRIGRYGAPPAARLAQWLVEQHLATTRDDGRLVPTERALELGAGIDR